MWNNYDYCYMHSVLIQDGKIKAFRFILGNKSFTDFGYYTTDLAGLQKLCAMTEVCKDFTIDNNFLKCDNVPRVIFTAEDAEMMNQIIKIDTDYSLLDFILWGAENDFYVIDSELDLTSKQYVGTAFTHFANIQVSQSTMSLYAKIFSKNTLRNEMLVTMLDGQLEVSNFHFIKHKTASFPEWFKDDFVTSLGDVQINNELFELFQLEYMPLYSNNFVRASAMINKGMTQHVKYRNLIDTLTVLRSSLEDSQTFNLEREPVTWVGGNNNYKTAYGVYFKSSADIWSKEKRANFIDYYFNELLAKHRECDAIIQAIQDTNTDDMSKLVLKTINYLWFSDTDTTSVIMNCTNTIQGCKLDLLRIDLFLYKIRICSYVNKIALAPKYNPILVGSDEIAFTKISYMFE